MENEAIAKTYDYYFIRRAFLIWKRLFCTSFESGIVTNTSYNISLRNRYTLIKYTRETTCIYIYIYRIFNSHNFCVRLKENLHPPHYII